MVELLNGGAFLVNGNEIIPDSAEALAAVESKTGKKVTKEEAKQHNQHKKEKMDKHAGNDLYQWQNVDVEHHFFYQKEASVRFFK